MRHRRATRGIGRRAATIESSAGFSMLEVAVAIFVLLLVLVAAARLVTDAVGVGADSRLRAEAVSIANDRLDAEVQTGSATLIQEVGDASLGTETSGPQTFTLEREVSPYDPANAACVSPASDPTAMLLVTVWATWAHVSSSARWWVSGASGSTTKLVKATSLVAIPQTDFNSADGAIVVTITGANNQAIAGVTVTITGPPPATGQPNTTYTETTTSGGCVAFSNLIPGSWTVSGTEQGYIDGNDDWNSATNSASPLSSTVSVSEGESTTVAFTYDQEGFVKPVYTLSQGTVPAGLNLPLSLYSTRLSTSPYVSTAPAAVFPFSSTPSYDVVAGSCGSESDPDGSNGTVDGQPVQVTAGQTSTVTIPLQPLTVEVTHGGTAVSGATVSASVPSGDANCPSSGTPTAMPTINLGTTGCTGACLMSEVQGPAPTQAVLLASTGYCAASVTLSSSPNPSSSGQSVTFTATVTNNSYFFDCWFRGTPTGTVTFKSGSTTLGTASLGTNGSATYSTKTLAVGTDQITASYSGDSTFQASSSGTLYQVVSSTGTTTTTTTTSTTTTIPTTTTTTSAGAGVPVVQSGLPYGKFQITAVYNGVTSSPVTVVIKASGIYVNGSGTPVPFGSTITVAD